MNLSLFPKGKVARLPKAKAGGPAPVPAGSDSVLVLGVDPGTREHGVALVLVSAGGATLLWARKLDTEGVLAEVRRGGIGLVAIETSMGVHPGIAKKRGIGAAIGVARSGNGAVRGDGVIEGVAVERSVPVARATASEWRKAIVGKGSAKDAQIALVIPRKIARWPERSNAHQRDAAGVAMFCARRWLLKGGR